MLKDEATALAVRIAQTWNRGLPAHVWEEDLVDLDPGRAGTTYARLRRSLKHPPSVADFFEVYNELGPVGVRRDRDDCPRCNNGGWVDAPEDIRHAAHCIARRERWHPPLADDECNCHAVVPCRCEWGRDHDRVFGKMSNLDPSFTVRKAPVQEEMF